MRTSSRFLARASTLFVALATAGAACFAGATPAMATSLTLTYFGCQSNAPGAFDCYVSYQGGTAPYTVNWYGSHTYFTDKEAYEAHGRCITGVFQVEVVVTDSASNQVSSDQQFPCSS